MPMSATMPSRGQMFRPNSIPAEKVDMPSPTDDVMGGLGSALSSFGAKTNPPTNQSAQFELTHASPVRLQATNYMLSEMNVPNLSPLSKKLRAPFMPDTQGLNYA